MQNLTEFKNMIKDFSLEQLTHEKEELERQLVLMIANPDVVEKLSAIETAIAQHKKAK